MCQGKNQSPTQPRQVIEHLGFVLNSINMTVTLLKDIYNQIMLPQWHSLTIWVVHILRKVARDIWLWCIEKKIWLSATRIPGIQNETADRLRRNFQNRTEWQLQPSVFKLLTK